MELACRWKIGVFMGEVGVRAFSRPRKTKFMAPLSVCHIGAMRCLRTLFMGDVPVAEDA